MSPTYTIRAIPAPDGNPAAYTVMQGDYIVESARTRPMALRRAAEVTNTPRARIVWVRELRRWESPGVVPFQLWPDQDIRTRGVQVQLGMMVAAAGMLAR